MLNLLKYELSYNWYHLLMLSIFFIAYTFLSLFNFQLTDAPEFKTDYWGGIYSIVIYAFLFSIWGTRLKEKRLRYHGVARVARILSPESWRNGWGKGLKNGEGHFSSSISTSPLV